MTRFRIGIDLGTTNCALAATEAGDPDGRTFVLAVSQDETAHSRGEWPTLPSFLYLAPGAEEGRWQAGRWARSRAAEVPGRVIGSAKSWLIHHAADRRARFLPLGDDVAPAERLSPVGALAELLRTLAGAWNAGHPDAPLTGQEIAVTVPASFDPAAQQLTLEAAKEAGFPASTILLEEPQAAFYAWLESHGEGAHLARALALASGGTAHVLVADIGGGTTDFSLFAVESGEGSALPKLRRIAVSNHLLLGGDNLDLALAHFLEARLSPGSELPPTAFAQLLAQCRQIKEEALETDESGGADAVWPVAVALPGSSLLAGTRRAEISASEVARLLLEGFLPAVGAGERPLVGGGGLREMGLPYAKDPAITRHLADFLRGRPPVDFLLCNGGVTKARSVRERLLENVTRWQAGRAPRLLENPEPDLAVARGAARFLHLRALGDPSRIEAGAAYSYYVGVGQGKALCVLPLGAGVENPHLAESPGLRALVGKPAAFPLYRHARRPGDKAGGLVRIDGADFSELPPIETLLSAPEGAAPPKNPKVRVRLRTTLRSTGLLRVELLCAEPGLAWREPWPLEFSLRGQSRAAASPAGPETPQPSSPAVPKTGPAAAAMARLLGEPVKSWEKLTANAVFSAAEKVLGTPRAAWNGAAVRSLFDAWMGAGETRLSSPEHEETWLHVAGYLLRPGCGMPGDAERIDALWPILGSPPRFPRKSVKLQRWICARRLAAGLDSGRAGALWREASADWPPGAVPSAEIAQLAGALESLPAPLRAELAGRLGDALLANPNQSALWKGLGRLLSRALFHAGAEQIVAPDAVVELWEKLRRVETNESIRPEAANAWLRAARRTGLRPLDLPNSTRKQIDDQLRRWGLNEVRRHSLHEVVPLVTSDQAALLGESLPAGLSILE